MVNRFVDEAYKIEPNTELLVTVLSRGHGDSDRGELFQLSTIPLARAYGDAEPEYSLEMIKDSNPDYGGSYHQC
jgi:hypothetical protein